MAERARKGLRVVEPGESAPAAASPTLAGAAAESRLALLAKAREKLAEGIDAGPPAHTLGRMVKELLAIDAELRRLQGEGVAEVGDPPWITDAASIPDAPWITDDI